jgi:LL-H family phage holin
MSDQLIIALINDLVPLIIAAATVVIHRAYLSLPKDVQQKVFDVAQVVVPAVEQSAGMLVGPAKKQQAVVIIGDILGSLGLKNVSPALIDAAIEAAVYAMNSQTMTAQTAKVAVISK